MNNSENIKSIIDAISKQADIAKTAAEPKCEKTIFEFLNIKDIEKIISELDEDKKAKLIEIMKTIK